MNIHEIFVNDPIDKLKLAQLTKLMDTNRGKNGIDVISGMSGGRDSIYQAFLLSQILNKDVLCFSWANDFMSLDARNVLFSSVSSISQIQLLTFALSQEVYGAYFCSMHKVFKRFCFCAHTMLLKAIPYAINHEIPFLCVGYSPDQINGKKGYDYGTTDERIKRLKNYIISYREMVLYAVEKSFPSMLNKVDSQLFREALMALDKIDSCDTVPGMLMLAEYLPWSYSTVQTVVYDYYGIKNEGRNCLHSNCKYESIRGYVEYLMHRPFLKNEAEYIINKGGLNQDEALIALQKLNVNEKEPSSLSDFLELTKMSKSEFYNSLEEKMDAESLLLLSNFVNAMIKLQGYRLDSPIHIIE